MENTSLAADEDSERLCERHMDSCTAKDQEKQEYGDMELETVLAERTATNHRVTIGFEPGDMENPHNWSMVRKSYLVSLLSTES